MTEDMTKSITLYHNLFLACLVLFLICVVIAAALFFLLHISDAVAFLTGRRARKQIEQMEKDNAANTADGRIRKAGNRGKKKKDANKKTAGVTEVLGQNETPGTTEVLEQNHMPDAAGVFQVEREVVLVHTEESI